MAVRPIVIVAAGLGMVVLAGIAVAAAERGESNEVSQQRIALKQVPQGAMAGGSEVLASVSGAQLVKLKDGRTVYELEGTTHTGERLDVYVAGNGQVLRTEGEAADD